MPADCDVCRRSAEWLARVLVWKERRGSRVGAFKTITVCGECFPQDWAPHLKETKR